MLINQILYKSDSSKTNFCSASFLQRQAILERLADSFRDLIIAVRIGVEGDGIYKGHVDLTILHDALVRGDVYDLADHAAAVFRILVFDEFAFQTQRELVDNGSIHVLRFGGGQAAAGELVIDLVAALDAKIVRFHDMGRVRDAHGKGASGLYVLHRLMRFGQVQRYCISLLHGPPCGIHYIDASILIVGRDHQYRHRENSFCNLKILSHTLFPFLLCNGLSGFSVFLKIINYAGKITSADIHRKERSERSKKRAYFDLFFVKKVELDYEHGRKIYEVTFYKDGYEYEYDIDAESGKVLKFEKDLDD